jgi:hypothetical protein
VGPGAPGFNREKETLMGEDKPPQTYLEWVHCIDSIHRNEDVDSIIRLMEMGDLDWTSGVAERFTSRLCELIDKKIKDASDQFQTDMRRSSGDEIGTVHALLSMRRTYTLVFRLASIPVLSENVGSSVQEMVSTSLQATQKSLEESAKKDCTGQMARLIRNIPIIPSEKTNLSTNLEKESDGKRPKREILIK